MLLAQEPPRKNRRGHRHCRAPHRGAPARRRGGAKLSITASNSHGIARTDGEREVRALLKALGIEYESEDVAIAIPWSKSSSRHPGKAVFDFRVLEGNVLLEVASGGPSSVRPKQDAIAFIEKRYGLVVVLITNEVLACIQTDPQFLVSLITEARRRQQKGTGIHWSRAIDEAAYQTDVWRRKRRNESPTAVTARSAGRAVSPALLAA